jgi:diguanylate cyclase (GGDEF)-like protein
MTSRILLIEDNPLQGESTVAALSDRGFEVAWAQTGAAGLRLATERTPDCIILDVQLPDIDGYSVCRFLAARELTREIPVIFLTTKGQVEDKIRGLETGATDYLAKPFDTGELEARIHSCIRTRKLQQEVRDKNRQLEDLLGRFRILASTDELTGLFNRRRFFEELEREFQRHRRYGSALSLMMLDIDHFKRINDTLGHQAGDIVLREVAQLLAASVRRTDTVGRYGGEEFASLLPETRRDEAIEVAERFRAIVEARAFQYGEQRVTVTVSIGISIAGEATDTEGALIRAADDALYRAKSEGRNRVVCWEPGDPV